MRTPARTVRRPLLTAVAAASVLVTAGCGGGSKGDTAEEQATATAKGFVTSLTSGDLSAVEFTSGTASAAQKDYASVVAGMGGLKPSVTLGRVTVKGDAARAVAAWTWHLTPDHDWTYDATVPLTRAGGASGSGPDGGWTVDWSHQDVQPGLTAASVLDLTPITPERGKVLGDGGTPLVVERSVVHVGIDRSKVPPAQAAASARSLAGVTGIDARTFAKEVVAAGPRAFVEAITYRLGQVPDAVQSAGSRIEGVALLNAHLPLAPTKEFAAPILGTVGPVTAEILKDDPGVYHEGDEAGLSGLQARYDDQLRGTPGAVVSALAGDGGTRQLERVPATSGTTLHLTLDKTLQTKAETLLADVKPASAIVAIRPSTGAVLVAANGPGNDGQNLATYGRYAPGSTFKTASSLALLRRGLTPDSVVPCTSTITVDGRVFTNDSDFPPSSIGRIALHQALADSCNTAYISQRGQLESGDLTSAAAALGMGVDHEVGYPAYFGSVTKATSQTGAAADMIGQGTILASPLTMATVMATIENGALVVPQLVEDEPGIDTAPPAGITPLTTSEDTALTTMMRDVVTSGTGRGLADVPGAPVIAKTGTAEFDAGHGKTLTHAWMIAAQGDLAVAVFVDQGTTGSGTAGPILEAFLRAAH